MPDVDKIIDFEHGVLSWENTIELFQELVDNGMAWRLQGFYGRMAMELIEAGEITPPEGLFPESAK